MSAVTFSETWPTSLPQADTPVFETPAAAVPAAQTPQTAAPVDRVAFLGNRRAYWWLIIRGAALQILTLGLYRFWQYTDMRRVMWANTSIDGESLEYTGTPEELLFGFLMAIGVLVPIYSLMFVLTLEFGMISQFSGLIGVTALAIFGQYAAYRMRRYRLTRTVLRGVRFHQTGSALVYALKAFGWKLLNWLTLGLTYPWSLANLERYKMRHTFYGNVGGQFAGTGSALFARGIAIWLAIAVPFVGGPVVGATMVDWDAVNAAADLNGAADLKALAAIPNFTIGAGLMVGGVLLSGLLAVVLYPALEAVTMRWWLAGLRLGQATATSDLRIRRYYGAYTRFILYVLGFALAAGCVMAGASTAAARTGIDLAAVFAPIADLKTVGAFAWYVTLILAASSIYQVVIKYRLWQVAAASVTVINLSSLENVQASDAASSAVGEGLADALLGTTAL
jgi:uncharacterized membrane protein YjgN (DUF898 family)